MTALINLATRPEIVDHLNGLPADNITPDNAPWGVLFTVPHKASMDALLSTTMSGAELNTGEVNLGRGLALERWAHFEAARAVDGEDARLMVLSDGFPDVAPEAIDEA